jgi:hypothetical protein
MSTRALNLILPFVQIAAPFFTLATGIGLEIGTRAAARDTPAVPAGYAFSIWSVIFVLFVCYGIYQFLRPRRLEEGLLPVLRPFTALAMLNSVAWMLMAQAAGFGLATTILIWALLFAALPAQVIVARRRGRLGFWSQVLVLWPVSLLAGWVTVAVFADASSALAEFGRLGLGLSETTQAAVFVGLAGVVGAFVTRVAGTVPFVLAVAWGLAGVIYKNVGPQPNLIVAGAALTMLALLGVVWFMASRRLAP